MKQRMNGDACVATTATAMLSKMAKLLILEKKKARCH
jgi:hypothetical protein